MNNTEVVERIAKRLPEGVSVDNLRFFRFPAVIEKAQSLTSEEKVLVANEIEAGSGPPLLTDGVPTVMRISAWMCHEGYNRNGVAFVADELGAAADRIRIPNVLPMDWNHSAVVGDIFSQRVIGMWYSAEKRWDPNAVDGKGAYGILMNGLMWSWVFPEYSDMMLAEQARNGHLDFSMACTVGSSERTDEGEILHDPVFLTLSALDVTPADADAIGYGDEGPPNTDEDLSRWTKLMTSDTYSVSGVSGIPLTSATWIPQSGLHGLEGFFMMTTEEKEALETEIAELKDALESAKSKITELEVINETLVASGDEMQAVIDAQTADLNKYVEAAEAARKLKALDEWHAWYNSLPEAYVSKLEERGEEDVERFVSKWQNATPEARDEFRTEIETAVGSVHVGQYLRRSMLSGPASLATMSGTGSSTTELIQSIRKK